MKLKEIEIYEYKSIKRSIKISLNEENKMLTFIGKNGSGKSNLLQAIRKSITKQSHLVYLEQLTLNLTY